MSWTPRHPALQRLLSTTPKEFSGVRANRLSFTWLSNFHGPIDNEILLAMGLRSRALQASLLLEARTGNLFNLSKYSGVRTSKNLLHQALSANHSGAMFDVCKRLATVPGRCCSHYTRYSFSHRHSSVKTVFEFTQNHDASRGTTRILLF